MKNKGGVKKNEICNTVRTNTFVPNEYQKFVKNYFFESRHKGLLLYHKLGSGKTCTSIIIADAMLKRNRISKVYVITPGSLRTNWISEYCKVCGNKQKFLKNFIFITYNFDVKDSIMPLDFNNSLVIIDEVHNLIGGIKNFSKNAYAIYYKIVNSNCRVLALSGTPVVNQTLEFAILGSILSNKFNWILINGDFENVEKGKSEWNNNYWNTIKQNPETIKQLLSGIVSYYPGDLSAYPEVRYFEPFKCEMSEQQFSFYKEVQQKEARRRFKPPPIKLKFDNPIKYKEDFASYVIAIQWTLSKAASNCLRIKPYDFIPDLYNDKSYSYTIEQFRDIISKLPGIDTINTVDKIIENLKQRNGFFFENEPIPFKYLFYNDNKRIKIYGWLTDEILKEQRTNIFNISKKYSVLLTNIILNPNQKHIVFSFYYTVRGLLFLHSLLSKCGIKTKLYSGDKTPEERQRMIDNFNHPSNKNGENIQVMLLTKAGGEGISFLGVNHVHIIESSIKENINIQAIGRAVRYKSHIDMPKDRQYVNVYRYWSVHGEEVQIDEMLYKQHFEKNFGKKTIIDEFITLIENYSIEAIGHGNSSEEIINVNELNEAKIEEEDITISVSINGKEHIISIPSSFSVGDTTNYLISKYLLPPLRIKNDILTNVLIDLNIIDQNNFNSISVNIDSINKILKYTEDNLILYTYNVENVDSIQKLIFKSIESNGKFTLRNLSINISIPEVINQLKIVLEEFYKKIHPNIIIEDIKLFDNKKMILTNETNLLFYYLNKKIIEFEFITNLN